MRLTLFTDPSCTMYIPGFSSADGSRSSKKTSMTPYDRCQMQVIFDKHSNSAVVVKMS